MRRDGAQIVAKHVTRSGEPLTTTAWLRLAVGRRGVVGIVDVPGVIKAGDEVEVRVYEEPAIRLLYTSTPSPRSAGKVGYL